ncbi:MAG: hypothetical protein NWF01_11615 [Candidatus Bathyarchaeota archaeon]|nr:hypothetical protein [Candidatus Bathyarchaeota archaeon]
MNKITSFKQQLAVVPLILVFILLTAILFITADKSLTLTAYSGPLNFWLNFPWLNVVLGFAGLSVFLLLPKIKKSIYYYLAAFFIAISAFSIKIIFPYYLFNGLVHYDIFTHYLNVNVLASQGIQASGYLYWPNTFLLTDVFEQVTGTIFPLSTSILAIIVQGLLVFVSFVFIKRFFGPRAGILSIVLLILVEPKSIHYSPFTITLSLILISLFIFFYGLFTHKQGFLLLSFFIGAVSIAYHAYLPLTLGLLLLVIVCSYKFFSRFSIEIFSFPFRKYLSVALILLVSTICWWLYSSLFVFRTSVFTLESMVIGEITPVARGAFATSPLIPEIADQLAVMSQLGKFIRFFLPLAVVVPVLLWALYLFVKKRLDVQYIRILLLASVALTTGAIWFALGVGVPIGFSERFLFIFDKFLILLTSISVFVICWKLRHNKFVYGLIMVLFVGAIAISPITNASSYSIMYYSCFNDANVDTAVFASQHSVDEQSFNGDLRFGGIVKLFAWPNLVSFSRDFNNKINDNNFEYSSDAIIISSATLSYTTVGGVSDITAEKYVAELPDLFNLVYNNGYDLIYE